MYKLKHFKVYELVDQQTYALLGDNAARLFKKGLLKDIDSLRENLDRKITVNDWYWGGRFSQRGYRSRTSDTGGLTSQHRDANAIDLVVEGMTAEEVRIHIKQNREKYPSVNRLEEGVSWVHIDGHPDYTDRRIYGFYP